MRAIEGRWSPDETDGTGDVMTAMIQIHGPHDGKFVAQFLTADGRSLAIFVPEAQAEVLRDIQEHIPYGLAVQDIAETAS
jgi:hypothetical protein